MIRDTLAALAAVILMAWWTRQARMAYVGRHALPAALPEGLNPFRPVRTLRPALAAVVARGWAEDGE